MSALAFCSWLLFALARAPALAVQNMAADLGRNPLASVQSALKDMFDNEAESLAAVRRDFADDTVSASRDPERAVWAIVAAGIFWGIFVGFGVFMRSLAIFHAILGVFGAQQTTESITMWMAVRRASRT